MSSLTQKLVSSRTMTLIADISKDFPTADSIKDYRVFLMVGPDPLQPHFPLTLHFDCRCCGP